MDKRFVASPIIAILAMVLFWLPSAFRPEMVVTLGIVMANSLTLAAQVAGVLCLAMAIGLGFKPIHQAIEGRLTKKAELALESQSALLRADETNLDIIRPALNRVAKQYPSVAAEIQTCIKQIEDIQDSLDDLVKILSNNAGVVALLDKKHHDDGKYERLIQQVLVSACPGLVGITYYAERADNGSIDTLAGAIRRVVNQNQAKVNGADKLVASVIDSLTRGDPNSTIAEMVDKAIFDLQKKNGVE